MFQPVLRVLELARALGTMAVDNDHGVGWSKRELFHALANARHSELYLSQFNAPKSSLGNLSQSMRDLLEFVQGHHPTSTFGDLIHTSTFYPGMLYIY